MASQPPDPVEPNPPLIIRISGYGTTAVQDPPDPISGDLTTEAYDMLARDSD
jgi:hypothetical protein